MSKKRSFIHTESSETTTYALLLGNDIPFLADVIAQKLESAGCVVHTKAERRMKYDYLLVFGAPENLTSEFTRLRQGGKAVFMITDDHKIVSNNSKFPIVSLSANKQFSADALADTILKKLFTAQPLNEYTDDLTKPPPQQKREIGSILPNFASILPQQILPKKQVIKWSLATMGFILFIASPFLAISIGILISAKNLQTLTDTSLPLRSRKNNIQTAQAANATAQTVFKGVRPVFSKAAPDATLVVDNTLNILVQSTQAAKELLEIEAIVSIHAGSLKKPNADLFTTVFPDIHRRIATADQYLASAETSATLLQTHADWPGVSAFAAHLDKPTAARSILAQASSFIDIAPALMAHGTEKTYLILFQNNFELRPTGGFIGSFGTLTVENGVVKHLSVEDVYEADGQLKGSVTPPDPIAAYLEQPNWFLRDSNWEPDFALSAAQAEWFLEKEIGARYDGVIAVDMYVLRTILMAIDGIYVPDYRATVTADDFFLKLQTDTHANFFPGSSKKRDLIASLASALLIELTERDDLPHAALLEAIYAALEEKHLLISLHDRTAQQVIDQHGWGGRIVSPVQQTTSLSPYRSDYLMLVEANLGVNKVNYYIERELFLTLTTRQNTIEHELIVYYKNDSPYQQSFFSGTYKNYLRVLIPKESTVNEVFLDDKRLEIGSDVQLQETSGKTTIATLLTLKPKEEQRLIIKYSLPIPSGKQFLYQLMVQKQPGTDRDAFVFKVRPEPYWAIAETELPSLPYLAELSRDRLISVDFESVK